jgi:hypothetical protein
MGYTTDFDGSFKLSRPATAEEMSYVNRIASTRRMQRDVTKLMELYKGEHGNPFAKDKTNADEVYGFKGEYFAKDDNDMGQSADVSVIDFNASSGEVAWAEFEGDLNRWAKRDEMQKAINADIIKQPGLWCQWELQDDTTLAWDGNEKFYNYIEWLQYLIAHFFKPWGINLNGECFWQGEDNTDMGKIVITDNVIEIYETEVEYKHTRTI